MAADTGKIAKLLKLVAQGVAAHDRENPGHHTWGIGMAYFDIERLGLEEGEELLPGIVLQGEQVAKAKTVDELLKLVRPKLAA